MLQFQAWVASLADDLNEDWLNGQGSTTEPGTKVFQNHACKPCRKTTENLDPIPASDLSGRRQSPIFETVDQAQLERFESCLFFLLLYRPMTV